MRRRKGQLYFVVFLAFMFTATVWWMGAASEDIGFSPVSPGSENATGSVDEFGNATSCDIDGWTDIVGAAQCGVERSRRLLSLTDLASENRFLSQVILTSLGIAAAVWLLLYIRGSF